MGLSRFFAPPIGERDPFRGELPQPRSCRLSLARIIRSWMLREGSFEFRCTLSPKARCNLVYKSRGRVHRTEPVNWHALSFSWALKSRTSAALTDNESRGSDFSLVHCAFVLTRHRASDFQTYPRFVARRAVIIIRRASRYRDEIFDTRFSLGISFDDKTWKLCKIAVPDAVHRPVITTIRAQGKALGRLIARIRRNNSGDS